MFLGFCIDRNWAKENAAKKIKLPRTIKPTEVVPFPPSEVADIVKACNTFGKTTYERLRVRAMILTLPYTALRIGDVSMFKRDRISRDGDRWRIFIRTEKRTSGLPARSFRHDGRARLRASSNTKREISILVLERARKAEDPQGSC